MKRLRTCVILLLLAVIPAVPVAALDWTGNVNLALGGKSLDEDDWTFSGVTLEDHDELSLGLDFRMIDWPVSIAIEISGSAEQEKISGIGDVEGKTGELRIGLKKIWEPVETIHPFLGGGLAFISGEVEAVNEDLLPLKIEISDDDRGTGFWLMGGVYWTLGGVFNLGFELGYSTAEISLFNKDVDAGGGHAALLLGYHW